nr:IS4 family transposase [Polaribacter filamentus]
MFSSQLKESFRVSEKDFTRTRKQSFSTTLLLMMNFLTKSLSIEIENFVNHLRRDCGLLSLKSFTKSAFVQCRKKIQPGVFKKLSEMLIDEFYTDNELGIKLWNGFRVLAVDGSSITLPFTDELKGIYGLVKNQTDTGVVQARVSVLYDVLNKYVLDSQLSPKKEGERALGLLHLVKTKARDLIIYDRGYPSYDFINTQCIKNIDYLMRIKTSFSGVTKTFIASNKTSQIVEIFPSKNAVVSDKQYDRNTPIKVRLLRVKLPSGETELLITSLLDSKKYPNKIFKELYFKRWGVEIFYDELKNKLKVAHFSGYSNQSILQDFNAAIFISNVQTLIVSDLEDEIIEQTKNRKLTYKINTNLSYGFLKNKIVSLFFSNTDMEAIVEQIKILFKQELVPIRPNRYYQRNIRKYVRREKPKVTKNQKDSI